MSDVIISINELLKANDISNKDAFITSQNQVINQLQKENAFLKEKINHLEQLISSGHSGLAIPISQEEIICIDQIQILKQKSANRELSLDEVKRLDLLIKNLRLVRQQSTQVIDTVDYTNLKESDLVAAINSPSSSDK